MILRTPSDQTAPAALSRSPGFTPQAPALSVEELSVEITRRRAPSSKVVDQLSYRVEAGETLAIIGESGSGKSMAARAVVGVLPPRARVSGGAIRLRGVDLLALSSAQRRALKGPGLSMVFQDSLAALNPVLPVGYQISEMFRVHEGRSRKESNRRAVEMLDLVKIPAASQRAADFPHQFSGGMRQRVMIAMALALRPSVVIADEPTTALDVTVQAQILELLAELKVECQLGLVLISHDLGVVADVADRVLVMYAGRLVESSRASDLYRGPAHPYTQALLASVPTRHSRGKPLQVLQGTPPDLAALPQGCAFRPRCPVADQLCISRPALVQVGPAHRAACHRCGKGAAE